MNPYTAPPEPAAEPAATDSNPGSKPSVIDFLQVAVLVAFFAYLTITVGPIIIFDASLN